ncbi:tetratricopeptide repeat protein [Erythrobacter sp. JK5]|uniref:tetratricopeptide repeat protein n=1 Tax=Erythrobacter sp. JK5 TaxID=2829500 RepID=UPI001BAA7AB3|nr:tetratricopeptide repeat protein [Erythrobacter sp. JK5]QUL39106.1 tetratricopeptide repeat protein [Erythrobacter sp. JK5]
MTGWLIVGVLALAALALAVIVLRLPREGWSLFAAALVFGLAGYAWQGSPGQPGSPKPEQARAQQSGEEMVMARRQLFDETVPKPNYLVTSDAFARRGQFGDAAGLLRKGLTDNPRHLEGWLALGIALVGHADGTVTPAARFAYERAIAIDPANPSPEFFLGFAYLRSGEVREARATWAALLEKSPEDAPWRADLERRVAGLDQMIANAPMLQR